MTEPRRPIREDTVLPARREVVRLGATHGELALPIDAPPVATLVCATSADHPVLRAAAWRLPALAGLGVLRAPDLVAAVALAQERELGESWLAGWSSGANEVLRLADLPVAGAVALSPSLHEVSDDRLGGWAGRSLTLLVAELDDHLDPGEASRRLEGLAGAEVVVLDWAHRDWVGETERLLDEVVRRVAPDVPVPLPTRWDGPVDPAGGVPIPRPRTPD